MTGYPGGRPPVTPQALIAGVDEAGRGPLAGPVVAAAVILKEPIDGLADSKTLSAPRRVALAEDIRDAAVAWSVAWSDPREIDARNILQATCLAMQRAVLGLRVVPESVLVDGNFMPTFEVCGRRLTGEAVIRGDSTVASISAASILAKVCRDDMMHRQDGVFPQYGFASHKGYGTAAHRSQLESLGPCHLHRYTFRPIAAD